MHASMPVLSTRLTTTLATTLAALVLAAPATAGTWGATRTLDGPAAVSSPPEPPLVAMNAGGHAIAAWNLSGGVRYAEQAPQARWKPSRSVPGGATAAGPLAVALGRGGVAAIAWTTVATRYVPSALRVSLRAPGGSFSVGTDVGPGTGIWWLRASAACDGSVTLLWLDAAGVRTMRLPGMPGSGTCDGRPGPGPWSAPETLSAGVPGAALPDLAANDDGAAVASWQAGNAAYAALRPAGAVSWLPAQQVSAPAAGAVWNTRPVIDAAGRPAVAFLDGDRLQVARADADGRWGDPVLVSGTQHVAYPALACTAAGDLLAAWQALDAAQTGAIWRAESAAAPGAGWTAPARVSAPAEDATWPSAAIAPDGGAAFVTWVDQAAGNARAAVRGGGAWTRQTLGPGWWGSTVPVAAGDGSGVAGWARTEGGNPNAAVLVARTWR